MTEPSDGGWSSPAGGYGPPPPVYGTTPPEPAPGAAPWYAAPAAPGVVPLRPLSVGELLDGSIKVIRRYPRPTLGLSAAIATVTTLISVLLVLVADFPLVSEDAVSGGAGSGGAGSGGAGTDPQLGIALRNGLGNVGGVAAGAVGYLSGLVLTGALMVVVGKAVQGLGTSPGEVWSAVRPRLSALLGLSLLTGLVCFGPVVALVALVLVLATTAGAAALPLLLLALPLLGVGVYLYTRLALAPAALVLEKAPIRTAMRRSWLLTKGSAARVFGVLLLATVIGSILTAIVTTPISVVTAALLAAGRDDGTAFLAGQQVAAGIASVLVSPFVAGVTGLLYVDRRMRAEGLDVALRAATGSGPSL